MPSLAQGVPAAALQVRSAQYLAKAIQNTQGIWVYLRHHLHQRRGLKKWKKRSGPQIQPASMSIAPVHRSCDGR
jgi:hypothetical protein